MQVRRALILGHFSTVGDVECLEVVKGWCKKAGLPYEIAPYSNRLRRTMNGAINPSEADSRRYSHLLVVCGPCHPDLFRKRGFDITRYNHCHKIGINLTMIEPIERWNPFDLLLERDSDQVVRPDLAFLATIEKVPVVGRCVIRQQPEYRDRQRHDLALSLIDGLIVRHHLPSIEIDTKWPEARSLLVPNSAGVLSSLIGRIDVLITNRLHGLVFSLLNGVPALAIDAVAGGDKVSAQARVLNWPACLLANEATQTSVDAAMAWCLSSEGRSAATTARKAALKSAGSIEQELAQTLSLSVDSPDNGTSLGGQHDSLWRRIFRVRNSRG